MSDYTELLKELQALKSNPPTNDQDCKALLNALRDAELAVERPIDTVHRLAWAPIQSAVARTAIDLKLFDIIASGTASVSLEDLSKQTTAKPLLLRRLLRYLSLYGLVDEPNPMQYLANARTITLAEPQIQAGLRHYHDIQNPAYQKLPEFLKATHYNDVDDAANTPFQLVHNTDQPALVWAMQNPAVIQEFGLWMAGLRKISPSWLDVFPKEDLQADTESTSPLFIDIGGSVGHQCEDLKHYLPENKRPIVLQDQAPVIEVALKTPGVENQVYDFFTPQPLKGASFYYIKSVLHDWPDDKVVEILKNQMFAMGPRSKILLDEILLPEKGGHWRAAEMDIALMACAGSFERTEAQWRKLFDEVGLKKMKHYYYDDQMLYAIQVLEKA